MIMLIIVMALGSILWTLLSFLGDDYKKFRDDYNPHEYDDPDR